MADNRKLNNIDNLAKSFVKEGDKMLSSIEKDWSRYKRKEVKVITVDGCPAVMVYG